MRKQKNGLPGRGILCEAKPVHLRWLLYRYTKVIWRLAEPGTPVLGEKAAAMQTGDRDPFKIG
ncbi:MAG TPA: hypothetical protein DIT32_00985 [Peptococcaceae bacterium]|nr:hypothetical protein [Peptococcaceae bacterium]